jgi:hypothetical protein
MYATVIAQPARSARKNFDRPSDVQNLRLRIAKHDDAMRLAALAYRWELSVRHAVLVQRSMAENDA